MSGDNPKHENCQNRFELFLLAEGEKKIDEKVVSIMANTSDFLLKKEDHTIGNLLAEHLKDHRHVLFAAYKVAHPNVPELVIRVQTNGTMTPREALMDVCRQLLKSMKQLSKAFGREWQLRQVMTAGEEDSNGDNGGNGGT